MFLVFPLLGELTLKDRAGPTMLERVCLRFSFQFVFLFDTWFIQGGPLQLINGVIYNSYKNGP